jgi:hypothetical protein
LAAANKVFIVAALALDTLKFFVESFSMSSTNTIKFNSHPFQLLG